MAKRRLKRGEEVSVWPGFVDVLTAILLVTVFLLGIFLVAEFVLTKALKDTSLSLEDVTSKVQSMQVDIQNAQDALEAKQQDIDRATLELKNIEAKKESLTTELQQLTGTLKLSEKTIAQLRSEQSALINDLEKSQKEENSLNERLIFLQRQLEDAELRAYQDAERFQRIQTDLEDNLQQERDKTQKYSQDIASLKNNIISLQQELREERLRQNASQRTIDALEAKQAQLAINLDETQKSNQVLARLVEQLRTQKQQLDEDREFVKSRLDESVQTLALLREASEEALRNMDMKRQDVADQLVQERSITTNLRAEITKLVNDITQLKTQRDGDREEKLALQTELAKLRVLLSETIQLKDDALATSENLKTVLAKLNADIFDMSQQLTGSRNKLRTSLEKQQKTAEQIAMLELDNQTLRAALLKAEQQQTLLIEREQALHKNTINELQASKEEIAVLNETTLKLQLRLSVLSNQLAESRLREKQNQTQIENLGAELNAALAERVDELTRYRSDFFGKVRMALQQVKGIEIKGDRFVFGSELLFASASAQLNSRGKLELKKLSQQIKIAIDNLPSDVDWILRIDGHTDSRPIRSPLYKDNRELSFARALSVLRELAELGLPSQRLVASGFGSTRPVRTGNSPEDFAANRRIEIKLTSP